VRPRAIQVMHTADVWSFSGTLNEHPSAAGRYLTRPASLFWHPGLPWHPGASRAGFSQCATSDNVIDEWRRPSFPAPDRTEVRDG
jgi:hypothetical protein